MTLVAIAAPILGSIWIASYRGHHVYVPEWFVVCIVIVTVFTALRGK